MKTNKLTVINLCLLILCPWTFGQTPTRLVTSFYPIYIATLNIAANIPDVEVSNMTPPITGCLHDYQVSSDDLKKLAGSSFFIINGAGMESFLDKAIAQIPDIRTIDASRDIELIEGHNAHVWVGISGAIQQVRNITGQLAAADPTHAEAYQANANAYEEKLTALRARMHEELKSLKTRDIITFHEAFPYFAKEFDLHIVAVIEREPGSEPSARDLADTIDTVRKAGVTALFIEPQYPSAAVETVARETGARIFILDPAVTGPMDPDAYLKIMERNLAELLKALR